jgi:hypothetical protein
VDPVQEYPACSNMPVAQQHLLDSITCTGQTKAECSSKPQCRFCDDPGCIPASCACGDTYCLVEKRPVDNRQITNIISRQQLSFKTYLIDVGANVYTDANVTFSSVPAVISRRVSLQAPDAAQSLDTVFRISEASYIYVLRDSRGTPEKGGVLPQWMVSFFDSCVYVCVYVRMSTL